jgi:hypothetical protein
MHIADPKLARLFERERTRRLLLMFAGGPRSVSDVAAAAGEPVGKVFYHVSAFLSSGLLKVARAEKRRGKPVKFYVTVAPSFVVPAELIDRSCTDSLAEELRNALEHNFQRSATEGVMFFADEDGNPQLRVCPPSDRRQRVSAAEFWQIVRLRDEDAQSLARELGDLLRRYEADAGEGREYLIHAAVAERPRA